MNRNPAEITYRKLRAPAQNGEALIDPPLHEMGDLLQEGIRTLEESSARIGGTPLVEFRHQAKIELQQLVGDSLDLARPIVASGHQPELFHPGVWFKNWLLHHVSTAQNANSVNVVIDNDLATGASIKTPVGDAENIAFEGISFARASHQLPWEERPIVDFDFFASFGKRVEEKFGAIVDAPVIRQLWPHVVRAGRATGRLGSAIAAGRQRLEESLGASNHELPLSRLCETRSFARFATMILRDIERFQYIYNAALAEYRRVHKLRSETHPAPDLVRSELGFETPFWLWSSENPTRRPMFMKQSAEGWLLTNHEGVEWPIASGDVESIESDLLAAPGQGVKIRPRALVTTMFLRVAVCDAFIHGVGGAKYDQATDAIAQRFFGVKPAPFVTATATLRLPWPSELLDQSKAVARLKRQLRDAKFNPQRLLAGSSDEQVSNLLEQRETWVEQSPPPGQGKQRRAEINRINHELQPFVEDQRKQIEAEIETRQSQQRFFQQATSREFSFALFPMEEIAQTFQKLLNQSASGGT